MLDNDICTLFCTFYKSCFYVRKMGRGGCEGGGVGVREGGGCEGGRGGCEGGGVGVREGEGQRESGYAILLSLLHVYFLVKKKGGG